MTNFEKWKRTITLEDMIPLWKISEACEACPVFGNKKYCQVLNENVAELSCELWIRDWAGEEL